MTDPDMGSWSYSYDSLGNLTGQTDARTCTTSLAYDGLNRLTNKSYSGTCSTTPAVSYTYDEFNVDEDIDNNGYRTGMNDANSGTTWRYDSRGRLETETRYITGSGTFKTNWTYNSADQVVTMLYPSNNTSGQSETVTYTYLPQMTLDTAIGTSTYVSNTLYDAAGRVTTRAFASSSFRQVYSYVPWASLGGGSLDVLKAGTNVDSYNNLMNLNYEYSVTGNIQSIVDGTNSNQVQCYEYDVLNRLTKGATNTGQTDCSFAAVGNGSYDERYAYDVSTGNLQSKTVRNINGTYTASTYGYQDTAHVHGVTHLNGTQKYWYDANGNQIKRIVGTYTYDLKYDAENRLIEVKRNGASFATFVYNGDGERVQSTIGGVVTAFVGNHLEWSGSATTMKKYYYAGSQRVAMRTGSSTLNFILGDHLGSSSVTTSSTGTSPKYQLYKPFGEVRYTSSALPTKYTFTGQYSNVADFGLMYYNARWYDVSLGRFAQADTIIPGAGDPLAWDRYSYSNNNPINYTDPTGHWPELPCFNINFSSQQLINAVDTLGQSFGVSNASQTLSIGLSYIGTGADVLSLGMDIAACAISATGTILGGVSGVAITLPGGATTVVGGGAGAFLGFGLTELALQPLIQLSNLVATIGTEATMYSDVFSGETTFNVNLENNAEGFTGYAQLSLAGSSVLSLYTGVTGWLSPISYGSAFIQSIAVLGDAGAINLPTLDTQAELNDSNYNFSYSFGDIHNSVNIAY